MNKTTLIKSFTFDAAHRLSFYDGPCSNLHGHTYKLEIYLSGQLDSQGMILDFNKLKDIYQKTIKPFFDHKSILFVKDSINLKIFKDSPEEKDWISWVNYNPTVENMASDILVRLSKKMRKLSIRIIKVRLWETPTSSAELYGER